MWMMLPGTWNEHKVLRDRMTKAWREYDESKPTLTANWDRNAKREPKPPPQPKADKPKPKPAQKAKAKPIEEPAPQVVFETPPVTPPPAPAERIVPKKEFKRDDEFWDLYNS